MVIITPTLEVRPPGPIGVGGEGGRGVLGGKRGGDAGQVCVGVGRGVGGGGGVGENPPHVGGAEH